MSTPIRLDIKAIDLQSTENADGEAIITMRLIDNLGIVVDVPMPRAGAEAFGLSLAEYSSTEPAWNLNYR